MRAGLATACLAPAATGIWSAFALVGDREITDHQLTWVSGLDLTIAFRIDALALMMTLLVSGIGALIFIYAIGYFSRHATGGTVFPASLLAFSTSMLGLVWADSIWTLFIFWELTSVTSFLLVGHKNVDAGVRTAARRALLITGDGGLVLLAGLLVLANQTGSIGLTDMVPVSGSSATLAAILILIGAATKSAQVPFHVWLPGAMAAPTPVSAYLHSATMVKAGVLLVAVLGPAFGDVDAWKFVGIAFGMTSMIWGAVGALRHRDAKLILAWGTVSQLGLLIMLFAVGTPKAVFAATAMLLAHALFKAALFLVVGEVDIRAGTRNIEELGGLASKMPISFGVALLAGLSMAGAPPLLGFMTKEAAVEAALGLSGTERVVVLAAVVGGSILTVAYTARFLVGVFGSGPATQVRSRRWAMTAPAIILGGAGIVGFIADGAVTNIAGSAAVELNAKAEVYKLVPWPGIKTAFIISMAILAGGIALAAVLVRKGSGPVPRPVGANGADSIIDGVLHTAPGITARVQHGSLPVYLATMAMASCAAAIAFLADLDSEALVWWDHPMQAVLAVGIVASALAGAFVGTRLAAALTLGAVGIGVSGLFVLHGAPDLALTQLLVETVIVVGFVIGLGHLARRFPTARAGWHRIRLAIAVAGGALVALALAASGSNPVGQAPVKALVDGSVDEGGGKNVVNVILTDVRALDTLGEVVVLATVAIGILALARTARPDAAT